MARHTHLRFVVTAGRSSRPGPRRRRDRERHTLGPAVYVAFVIGAKMFINSGHGGVTSIAGTFYPTAIRANGAAWASSVAKVAAMAGPWLGGVILDAGLGARGAFTVFSVCPAVMVLVLFALGRVQRRLPAEAEGALSAESPETGLAAARPAVQI
ncbi:hypothetical protein ACFCW6_00720 [Streptomyces sp. NPDC056333]|uniref:hypothetical protein n=1 Tax=Streptomyces sp. NPDC056333 TaxID=3345786 RepID=UPI0035DD23D5